MEFWDWGELSGAGVKRLGGSIQVRYVKEFRSPNPLNPARGCGLVYTISDYGEAAWSSLHCASASLFPLSLTWALGNKIDSGDKGSPEP